MTSRPGRPLWVWCLAGALALPLLSGPVMAGQQKEKYDARLEKLTRHFKELQADPSHRIPDRVLANARGLVILHQFKVGFVFAGEGGVGAALLRNPRTGEWSAPAFYKSAEGSYGLQIGGQSQDTVLVLMNDEGLKVLKDGSVKLGVDVRATAGPASAGGEAAIDSIKSPVLVYANAEGLFAGAAIETGGVFPDEDANVAYYGVKAADVLFSGKAKKTKAGRNLTAAIEAKAKSTAAVSAGRN